MVIINNKYEIMERIGSGSFGTIYKGENVRTMEKVAIKVESINSELKLLKHESIIYQYLKGTLGIPTLKWFGRDNYNYYMVLNYIGSVLRNRLPLYLVLNIGIQMIKIIERIHSKGLIHRDIKPDNFLIDSKKNELYLIDFGFCKKFVTLENTHIPYGKSHNIIGSLNYVSINGHNLDELSRRDDMESIGYVLIYLFCGTLNWKQDINERIKLRKIDCLHDIRIPLVIRKYLNNIRKLKFEDEPNYAEYIEEFTTQEMKENLQKN
jgi:serine/threonine protein kinase